MSIIADSIISGIAWEAFSNSAKFWADKINDFALRVYIANELRALEKQELSEEEIEKATDIIEATILETPAEIEQIEDKNLQKESFEKYVHSKIKIKNLYGVGVVNGGEVNQTFNIKK